MAKFNDNDVFTIIKTEVMENLQEKTISLLNFNNEIKPDINYAGLSKVNIKGELVDPHKNYTSSANSTMAYQKTVPSGVYPYASLDILGGMSYKSDNLIVLNDVAETTINGITYKVENGVITINGTATANTHISFQFLKELPVGTYSMNLFVSGTTSATNPWGVGNTASTYEFLITTTKANNTTTKALNYLWRGISSGVSFNNYVIKPMLVKGSTAPTTYQQGFESIRDSAVTSVISKDSNNSVLQTLNIPSEIQALNGYGWGVNSSVYNYIDFVNKKYIQKVARVDLGSLNFTDTMSSPTNKVWWIKINDMKVDGFNTPTLCQEYSLASTHNQATMPNMSYYAQDSWLNIKNTNCTNATELKTALSEVYLYYELATPIETDISQYIDDNSIQIEGNGTITFESTYNQDVPSEIVYSIVSNN